MRIGRSLSRLAHVAARMSGWRPVPVRSAKRPLRKRLKMRRRRLGEASLSGRSAAVSIARMKVRAFASTVSMRRMASGFVRAKRRRAALVAMTKVLTASAPTAHVVIAHLAIVLRAATDRLATSLAVSAPMAISPVASDRSATVPAAIDRLAIVRMANVVLARRAVSAPAQNPSRVKLARSVRVVNARLGIVLPVATVRLAISRAALAPMVTSLVVTGHSATVPATIVDPAPRVKSVRVQDLSMASSAPNVPAAIALRVIVLRAVIVLSATVRRVIGRLESPSARSPAAANPLVASRAESLVGRAGLVGSQAVPVVRQVVRAAAVPVVAALAGAVPRAAGVNAG